MEGSLTPFNFFDKIVCLSHDPSRWDSCLQTLESLNVKDRTIRYKGDNPLQEYIKRGVIPERYDPNHIDVIHARRGGCSLSHFNIIRMAKENNFKNVLIFEDDIVNNVAPNELQIHLNAAINELPNNWEIFYITASPTHIHGHHPPVSNYSENLCRVHAAHTTHAIAINSNVFDEILENGANMDTIITWTETWVAIDTFYIKKIHCKGNSYMPKKLLINQRNCFSDIENCTRNNGDFIKQSYNSYEPLIKEPLY